MRGLDVRETQVAGPWREHEEETKTQLIWRRTQGRGYDLLGAKCRHGLRTVNELPLRSSPRHTTKD